jgi:uncharacterized membrane protein
MPERVSVEDLELAAEWLDVNEGDAGEAEACHRVAEWLRAEADRRGQDRIVRRLAKEAGTTVQHARAFYERRQRS